NRPAGRVQRTATISPRPHPTYHGEPSTPPRTPTPTVTDSAIPRQRPTTSAPPTDPIPATMATANIFSETVLATNGSAVDVVFAYSRPPITAIHEPIKTASSVIPPVLMPTPFASIAFSATARSS